MLYACYYVCIDTTLHVYKHNNLCLYTCHSIAPSYTHLLLLCSVYALLLLCHDGSTDACPRASDYAPIHMSVPSLISKQLRHCTTHMSLWMCSQLSNTLLMFIWMPICMSACHFSFKLSIIIFIQILPSPPCSVAT